MTESTPATRAVRAGLTSDQEFRAVVPPVHLSSTYAFEGLGEPGRYDYSRSGNPTRSILADALAELEGGSGAVITASGMGAVTTVLHALLRPGGRVVAPFDCYGGTWRLLDALARRGWSISATRTRPGRRWRHPPTWCGWRRRPTRCCGSPTSRR